MTARPLQPSEYEIQREVEALRDIRRRSSTPGALAIDPDLPNQSPPASPTTSYWSPKPAPASTTPPEPPFPPRSNDLAHADHATPHDPTHSTDTPNNPADDPFHLFWVPASVHPEIAPAEFRAFLKEHARSPLPDGDSRSTLSPSSSLSRKRSMLSRQYKPKENEDPEDDKIVPIQRNRSFLYHANPGPQLTINDLQKLEELAEEAQQSDDPSRLRSVLRRSLSMNLSPTAIDLMDDIPDMGDEADAPIIVPPPGQILRRAARTKIRKAGLPGDGNGHRFGSRRGPAARSNTAPAEPRTSSDISSNDHSEPDHGAAIPPRRAPFTDDKVEFGRPDSFSEETSIYEAYARSEEDDASYTPVSTPPTSLEPSTSPPTLTDEPPQIPLDILSMASDTLGQSIPDTLINSPRPPLPPGQSQPLPPPTIHQPPPEPQHQIPVQQTPLHQPQPQRLLVPQSVDQTPSRTPSPAESTTSSDRHTTPHSVPSSSTHHAQAPPPRKEKDKKSLFKWGDKSGKKSKGSNSTEKEKESSFFGSLFGKKNKDSEYQSSMTGGTSGREAAQALLGASKSSRSYVPSSSPGLAPGIGGNPYARYPIHVERAIYRLSHIKLANPRRPLYEQVLISNLMFWYLGIINKAQNPTPTPSNNNTQPGTPTPSESDAEKEQREKEQTEREEKEKAEKERLERERQEKEQREREMEMKRKESGKRGSLTKSTGATQGNRRAEMPIKGPQYEMQHRVMEQEYGPYGAQPPRSPTTSTAHINGGPANPQQQFGRPPQQHYGNGSQQDPYYYGDNSGQRSGLPPGAMAPADQGWKPQLPSAAVQQQQQQQRRGPGSQNTGPPNRRSRSPPPQIPQLPTSQPMSLPKLNTSVDSLGVDRNGGTRSPARSLSATAGGPPRGGFSPQVNGGADLRKGNSAHAAMPYHKRPRTSEGNTEEEDVPLAVWQQQRGNRHS